MYRRYCRLFIEDSKQREVYAKKIENFKKAGFEVSKWVLDLIKFGRYFLLNDTSLKPGKLYLPIRKELQQVATLRREELIKLHKAFYEKKCGAKFCTKNLIPRQDFALPAPLIVYLTDHVKAYRKLIQTCKYFFHKKQVIPMWYLGVNDCMLGYIYRHEYSLYLNARISAKIENPIWLENTLDIVGDVKLMDKITRCEVEYLTLEDWPQSHLGITFSEYNILVKSQKVKEFSLWCMDNIMKHENGDEVTLEQLMDKLPNAYKM